VKEIHIKSIALANGDLYEKALFVGSKDEFITKVNERELISITVDKTEIMVNSEFIISIVF
jgi:hypothetical protein